MYDLVVVGSGVFGLTIAESVARRWNLRVAVVERRPHIGGNCYSELDAETGIEVHKYGAHIFHTDDEEVWNYVRRFTDFNRYVHHVQTTVAGKVYSLPVNLGTINQFFQAAYSPDQARELVSQQASEISPEDRDDNFETKGISLVGRPLFEAFFRGYTAKQWQMSTKDLPSQIITRLPVRYTYDARYFSDRYQGLPLDGYTSWFERMLDSPLIDLFLESDFLADPANSATGLCLENLRGRVPIVYTGAVDRYFDYQYGHLSWQTVDFRVEHPSIGDFQGCSVMNYGDEEIPQTRSIEFRHFHPERTHYPDTKTVVYHEFSRRAGREDEPYYPINAAGDREKLQRYSQAVQEEPMVFFGGRLGTYAYFDMDDAIRSALTMVEQDLRPLFTDRL